jgi:flagella basal body P-ring formation protein FlgA
MTRTAILLVLAAAPAAAEPVTVAGETIERGAIVEARALSTAEIPLSEIRAALGAEQVVGKQATRRIDAGRPIRPSDVREPLMVDRNSAVTLVVEDGALTITAAGRAMQGGQKGDVIRVQPLGSTRFIDGEIVAPGRVRVRAAS